jgi:hypothetical protein
MIHAQFAALHESNPAGKVSCGNSNLSFEDEGTPVRTGVPPDATGFGFSAY